MVKLSDVFQPSSTPSPRLISRVFRIRKIALILSLGTALSVLLLWTLPELGEYLPAQWASMAPATAICVSVLSALLLGCPSTAKFACRLPYLSAVGFTLLYSLYIIAEHFSLPIPDVSAVDTTLPMTLNPALYIALLSVFLLVVRSKQEWTIIVSDTLAYVQLVFLIALTSGYVFSIPLLIGTHSLSQISLPTLISFYCLFIAILPSRASRGWFSPIFGEGIGSQVSRLILPFTLATPFVVTLTGLLLFDETGDPASQYWTLAVIVTVISGSSALLVFPLARRVNALEQGLRHLSLSDEMTSVLNRRGFFLIGEHLYSQAARENTELGILFFDLDGLKQVNDTYGHETGSALLVDFARLLKSTFRHSDALGRLGGDEFAVVSCQPGLDNALRRLHKAVESFNKQNRTHYEISYSVGQIHTLTGPDMSFEDLLGQADLLMYKQKRQRKEQAQKPATDVAPLRAEKLVRMADA